MTVAVEVPELPAFLDRRTEKPVVFTYTMLHTYENICPHQSWRRFVKKEFPFISTPEMEWGNKVHTAFEYRVGGGKPLPENMAHWEPFATPFDGKGAKTEMKVALSPKGHVVDYFEKINIRYRCKIDTSVVNGEKAFLADWKTGNSKYENPFELAIQAMHLHAKNPQLKEIKGSYVWLKENRMSKPYDLSDTQATWTKCETIVLKMESDRRAGHFEKRQGPLCGYCPCLDCENNTSADARV